ncbi:uncharacterized protein LOC124120650 isoform X2 [Haliotis rufescens]|nr:uncharacterized protein LOC124120650 isoform X2 [Haliotis rufescens]
MPVGSQCGDVPSEKHNLHIQPPNWTADAGTDTNHLISCRSKSCQTLMPSLSSTGTQKSLNTSRCTVAVQCTPQTCDRATQYEAPSEAGSKHDTPYTSDDDSDSDEDYHPLSSKVKFEEFQSQQKSLNDHLEETKFLVFKSNLLSLFLFCKLCFCSCRATIYKVCGSLVTVQIQCLRHKEHLYFWSSQPVHKQLPLGNLAIACAIFFSSLSPVKALRSYSILNMYSISRSTFHKIQRSYIVPAISRVWSKHQNQLLLERKEKSIRLAGDARCCSPGHTAKYGSYTLIDVDTNHVLDIQLVQSNEVANSNAMELEGLKRGLAFLQAARVDVSDIITDRHTQIKAYLRKEEAGIHHWFDVWHVAKGIYKKLQKISKKKGLEIISLWAHSISNHLYWCAATSKGNAEEVQAKWLSIANHIANIHSGHGASFPSCMHGEIQDRIWVTAGTRAHKEIESILKSTYLLKDVAKLSPHGQTSHLEGFHSVICHFAPKFYHYHYNGMKARLLMSALHFNENGSRHIANTKNGHEKWSVSYPKSRNWEAAAKPLKTNPTYEYVGELLHEVSYLRTEFTSFNLANNSLSENQPPCITDTHGKKQQKQIVVRNHKTRFQ